MQNLSVPEDKLAKTLQLTSSACAIAGGTILAANIPVISKYGFIFLALSSSQMPIASLRTKDTALPAVTRYTFLSLAYLLTSFHSLGCTS